MVKEGRFGYVDGNSFEPMQLVSKYEAVSTRYLYRFVCDADGKPLSVLRPYDGTVHVFAQNDPALKGMEKQEWLKYTGTYIRKRYGIAEKFYTVSIKNGLLHFNGSNQDFTLSEYLPGLFFTPDGEAVDLRGSPPSFRNIKLYKACD